MDRGSQRWGGLRVPFQAWSGAQGGSPRLAREAAALGPTWSTCPGVSQGDLCRGHGLQVHSIADLEVMPLQTCQGLRAAFASFSARSRIVVRFVGVITSWSFVPKTPSLKLFFQTLSSLLRGPSWLPSEQTSKYAVPRKSANISWLSAKVFSGGKCVYGERACASFPELT